MEDEEECIYNLIPKPPPVIVKEPLHHSKFDGITGFCTVKKVKHALMGETLDDFKKQHSPDKFLKAHSRAKDLPRERTKTVAHGNSTLSKPPVPTVKEIPKMRQTEKKNFIVENWKTAPKTKKLHPEKPETFYTEKPDFGKVPKYLNRVKKEAANETAYWEEVRESMLPEDNETRCRLLSEEERLSILEGLNANMADLKRRYAALSFGQDNLSFRKKKEDMEAQMAQLEQDINTFSRKNIYITEG